MGADKKGLWGDKEVGSVKDLFPSSFCCVENFFEFFYFSHKGKIIIEDTEKISVKLLHIIKRSNFDTN